jgi:hypothetical protein
VGTKERELVRWSRADWVEHSRGCRVTRRAATRSSVRARYAFDGVGARRRTECLRRGGLIGTKERELLGAARCRSHAGHSSLKDCTTQGTEIRGFRMFRSDGYIGETVSTDFSQPNDPARPRGGGPERPMARGRLHPPALARSLGPH